MSGYSSPFTIPQRLIVTPGTPFAEITAVLAGLGFRRAAEAGAGPSLIQDEPEVAAWSLGGLTPYVFYSFNPLVGLRVLDVAVVPPMLRQRIVEALPTLTPAEIRTNLTEPNDLGACVLGLWGAEEQERLDLIPQISALAETASPVIAELAGLVRDKLLRCQEARLEILGGARLIAEAAVPLIETLRDPRAARILVPDLDGCRKIFVDAVADAAAALLLRTPPDFGNGYWGDPVTAADVTAAPAGLFRWQNELSERFPRGYRMAAGWLHPDRIWVAWRGRGAGAGTSYDGLVFLGERWCLLPKPYRLLSRLAIHTTGQEGDAQRP